MIRATKKIMKLAAKGVPGNRFRIWLLRRSGYLIGTDVYVGESLIIVDELDETGTVTIGDRVSLAPRVTLVTTSYPNESRMRGVAPERHGPITIGSDAWLGTGCILLPGVAIGNGAVVGAGSVVTRNVPAMTVVAGNPARILRTIEPTSSQAGQSYGN